MKNKKEVSGAIAVVRVRGSVHASERVKTTMKLLGINRANNCTVINLNPAYRGMLNIIENYVTWGEVKPEILEKLLKKRGRVTENKPLTEDYLKKNSKHKSIDEFAKSFVEGKAKLKDISGLKPVFGLNPPRKGFERKGIKKPYSSGGVLGYRGDKINDLIMRMI